MSESTGTPPASVSGWSDRARAQLAAGDAQGALASISQALALAPGDLRANLLRADALFFLGDIDGAANAYRTIIAASPAVGPAWLGLVSMKTLRLAPAEAEALEKLHRTQAGAAEIDRIAIAFALGKVLEDAGRYEDAFAAFAEANAAMRRRTPWDARGFLARIDHMLGVFAQAPSFAAPLDLGSEVIFIVSLPRAGSTLTEQILAAHPDVEGASELSDLGAVIQEESQRRRIGFPDWIATANAEDFARLGRRYLERTARWRASRPRFTDKMPNNWLYLGAALAMLPGARVIDCRRDPLETGWSCFKQLFPRGAVFSYDLADIGHYGSAYARTMARWSELFPDRIHRQIYEALLADPERSIRDLLDFCGLPFDAACLDFHHASRTVRTASAAQVREPLRRDTARADRYGALLDPLRDAMQASAAQSD
ncbi:MAG TPA: sulfotransferase [Rhodanobacteraceae bacterium]